MASAEDLERSLELAREVDSVFGQVLGLQRLGLLETGLGRCEAAQDRLCRALDMAQHSRSPMVRGHGIGRVLATLAFNRLEAGELPQAAGYLAEGYAMQRRVGDCPSCDVLLYPAAVPIAIALGDLEQAEAACRRAEESASAFRSQAWLATARYLRGLLATARGEWHVAAGSLERALQTFVSLDQPYDAARCLEATAILAERAGGALPGLDPSDSRRKAVGLYQRLGAEAIARKVKAAIMT